MKDIVSRRGTNFLSRKRLTKSKSSTQLKLRYDSTKTTILKTTDSVLSPIDEKKVKAIMLVDMSKEFDSISHEISKITNIKYIKNGRTAYVDIMCGGMFSE